MIILFKYCADVKNCESFRGFDFYFLFIYIYIYRLEKYGRNSKFVFFSLGKQGKKLSPRRKYSNPLSFGDEFLLYQTKKILLIPPFPLLNFFHYFPFHPNQTNLNIYQFFKIKVRGSLSPHYHETSLKWNFLPICRTRLALVKILFNDLALSLCHPSLLHRCSDTSLLHCQ